MQIAGVARARWPALRHRWRGPHRRYRAKARKCGPRAERGLDQGRDPQEADAAVEKCLYRDLVGGVQHRARAASGGEHVACKAQGRKALLVRRLEGQCAETGKIEPRGRRLHAVGPGKAVSDGRAHVGAAHLRQHRAVAIMNETVHDGLRVDQNGKPLCRHREQMMRFDQLERLVHQRRRIDGDLRAHRPVGMGERLLRGHAPPCRRGSMSGTARRRP